MYATDTPYYHLEVLNYSNNLILLTVELSEHISGFLGLQRYR